MVGDNDGATRRISKLNLAFTGPIDDDGHRYDIAAHE